MKQTYFKAFAILSIIAIIAFALTSCSAAHEGTTSPCYTIKHFVGYGPGGWGKSRHY